MTTQQLIGAFFQGVGSSLDISGTYYKPVHQVRLEDDITALSADWNAVGDDIAHALSTPLETQE